MRTKNHRKVPKKPRIEEFVDKSGKRKEKRLRRIEKEFRRGFDFLEKYNKAATIFGTARGNFDKEIYEKAEKLGRLLAENDYAVITGGGPGVMQAANKGAHEAGGVSVGINILLKHKIEEKNPYIHESESFKYFFTRKMMMAYASQVYFFFPGGFGTLDEFFEMVTLVQTKKLKPIPIVLVHKKYWEPMLSWIEAELYGGGGAISREDMNIYDLVDTPEEALAIAEKFINNNNRNDK